MTIKSMHLGRYEEIWGFGESEAGMLRKSYNNREYYVPVWL